jgi:hypothetical protein
MVKRLYPRKIAFVADVAFNAVPLLQPMSASDRVVVLPRWAELGIVS